MSHLYIKNKYVYAGLSRPAQAPGGQAELFGYRPLIRHRNRKQPKAERFWEQARAALECYRPGEGGDTPRGGPNLWRDCFVGRVRGFSRVRVSPIQTGKGEK